MNADRAAGAPFVLAAEIAALGLIHEIGHLLIDRYDRQRGRPIDARGARRGAWSTWRDRRRSSAGPLRTRVPGPDAPDPILPSVRLEELLLTRIANENPAIGPLRELVDDRILARRDALRGCHRRAGAVVRRRPAARVDRRLAHRAHADARPPRPDLAARPAALHPAAWAALLGDALAALIDRLDLAIGVLHEEELGLHRRFGGGGGPGDGPVHAPSLGRRRRRGRGLQRRRLVDAPARAHGQEHVRLAGPAVAPLRPRHPHARRHPGRGARHAGPLGRHRAVAHRPVAALGRLGADQADARQPGRRRQRLLARRLPDRRRPRVARRPTPTCASGPGPAASGWPATWSPTTWASTRAGSSSIPSGSCRCPSRPTRPTPTPAPTCHPDERVGVVLEDHYWNDSDAAVTFKRFDRWSGDERYVYHGNDGTSFPWNDTAQLDFLQRRGPRAGHPDDPRRRPALPGHPLRCRDGPRPEARPAAVVAAARGRRRHPVARRARHEPGRVRRPDAARVLARGRRPGRRRGPRHAPAGRGVLDARGLLRPDPGDAPRLQQRVHAHAPRRGRRGLSAAHPRDPRVRSGDPQALRQLHEQPRREDRGRAVRQGRQVRRRGDGHGDDARPADARARPGGGLRREVRDGVPAGDARGAAGPVAAWSATSARSSRCSIVGPGSPRRTTSCSTTS